MDTKDSQLFNINYEEIVCDRTITDGSFTTGVHNYRFNSSASSGACIVPNRCYFLVEYAFGAMPPAATGAEYNPVVALPQSKKITLASDFVSTMFNSCSFRIGGTDIQSVNSFVPQSSMLRKRLGLEQNYMANICPELMGLDNDFSRRLARYSSDGVYHRGDGLIDATPYNSAPLSATTNYSIGVINSHAGTPLARAYDGNVYVGTSGYSEITPVGGNYLLAFPGYDGEGGIDHAAANTALVGSIGWVMPANTVLAGTLTTLADTRSFQIGDQFTVYALATSTVINRTTFILTDIKTTTVTANSVMLILSPTTTLTLGDYKAGFTAALAGTIAGSGLTQIFNQSPYSQADPRADVVNGAIIWTPPLNSFFEESNPNMFYGDIAINMTPNLNYKKAIVESCQSTYYGQDINHGVDYAFGIKSMRLYVCRANLPSSVSPPSQISNYPMTDMLISNKSLSNGQSSLDFTIPYSTYKIVVWIQDASAGLNTKISVNRFKTRQYTGAVTSSNFTIAGLNYLQKYGQYSHTYDEGLSSIQVSFSGQTKPQTNFQSGNAVADKNPTKISMLQRYLMSAQNVDISNPQESETYSDWLSMGPYYIFDFEKPSDNIGTSLIVRTNFGSSVTDSPVNQNFPTNGSSASDSSECQVNLFVAAIYHKNLTLNYSEYGSILSVQTSM
jgi:hypothetical protein